MRMFGSQAVAFHFKHTALFLQQFCVDAVRFSDRLTSPSSLFSGVSSLVFVPLITNDKTTEVFQLHQSQHSGFAENKTFNEA